MKEEIEELDDKMLDYLIEEQCYYGEDALDVIDKIHEIYLNDGSEN